jgi:hypothetical protein
VHELLLAHLHFQLLLQLKSALNGAYNTVSVV